MPLLVLAVTDQPGLKDEAMLYASDINVGITLSSGFKRRNKEEEEAE